MVSRGMRSIHVVVDDEDDDDDDDESKPGSKHHPMTRITELPYY